MTKPFDPRSTIFTNLALDRIMPSVSPNAWKILCYAIRKTAGWADETTISKRKESDVISISQFRTGCGIASNDTVMKAIEECLENGYLIRKKDGNSFRYCINQNYELPNVTETVIANVTESVTTIVTETVNTNNKVNNNINSNILQNNLQTDTSTPAKKNGDNMNSEEYKKRIEESLFRSYQSTQIGYANFPEEIRPVVERMDKQWRFDVPERSKKKGGEFALWIESCRDLLDACGEYGVTLLDEMRAVWEDGMNTHGGTVPFVPNGPQGLLKTMRGFAAAKRRGEKYAFNYPREYKREPQSVLDV